MSEDKTALNAFAAHPGVAAIRASQLACVCGPVFSRLQLQDVSATGSSPNTLFPCWIPALISRPGLNKGRGHPNQAMTGRPHPFISNPQRRAVASKFCWTVCAQISLRQGRETYQECCIIGLRLQGGSKTSVQMLHGALLQNGLLPLQSDHITDALHHAYSVTWCQCSA